MADLLQIKEYEIDFNERLNLVMDTFKSFNRKFKNPTTNFIIDVTKDAELICVILIIASFCPNKTDAIYTSSI